MFGLEQTGITYVYLYTNKNTTAITTVTNSYTPTVSPSIFNGCTIKEIIKENGKGIRFRHSNHLHSKGVLRQ